jgi:hypothetical protein
MKLGKKLPTFRRNCLTLQNISTRCFLLFFLADVVNALLRNVVSDLL